MASILLSLFIMTIDLGDYQWKNRIVVTRQTLPSADPEAFQDRQLKTIPFDDLSDPKKEDLLKGKKDATIWLIGLDGGIKYQDDKFPGWKMIYYIIDQMPMRARELQKRKDSD